MKKFLAVVSMALVTMGFSSVAQANEGSVQGSTQAGGGLYSVVGRAGGELSFSVTGRFNDVAELVLPSGQVVFRASIRQIWNGEVGPSMIVVRVQLADGRSRVIVRVGNALRIYNGGQLRLLSGYNGQPLDSDIVIIHQ